MDTPHVKQVIIVQGLYINSRSSPTTDVTAAPPRRGGVDGSQFTLERLTHNRQKGKLHIFIAVSVGSLYTHSVIYIY